MHIYFRLACTAPFPHDLALGSQFVLTTSPLTFTHSNSSLLCSSSKSVGCSHRDKLHLPRPPGPWTRTRVLATQPGSEHCKDPFMRTRLSCAYRRPDRCPGSRIRPYASYCSTPVSNHEAGNWPET